jgi:tetratricopeptide (TPR) repeat protein
MKALIASLLISSMQLVACNGKSDQNQAITGTKDRSTEKTSSQRVTATANISLCRTLTNDKAWYASSQKAPLLTSLKVIHYPVTTRSQQAQRYFDQGLTLAYSFNHAEAARSFFEATRIDSTCAACYWGFSYVLGPNYNAGMEDDNYSRAYQAVQKALKLASNATVKEQGLIKALTKRYPAQPVTDRTPFDRAYSIAMKQLSDRFPDDADIGTLYAESLMDRHPWDLWQKDGKPRPWTPEIVATLERLKRQHAQHLGIHHFYIHAVEASSHPQRGLASARFLQKQSPGTGHLEHMPSHIYMRTGDYHQSTLVNQRAVEADGRYLNALHAQGAYPLSYYPHNLHFIAAAATLEGNRKVAMAAAQRMAAETNHQIMKQAGWGTLQHYYAQPYYVAIKFGQWDTILHMKNAEPALPYPTALWHFARGMAYLGKNDLLKSQAELDQLAKLANDTSMKALTIWNINATYDLVQIAQLVLKGEFRAKEKNYSGSVALLREAVEREDKLNYNEPPDWLFSVRHHLGAVLLEAKRWKAAEQVYLEDLALYPRNGWALYGLYKARQGAGDVQRARLTKAQFNQAWLWADTPLISSRFL